MYIMSIEKNYISIIIRKTNVDSYIYILYTFSGGERWLKQVGLINCSIILKSYGAP